jgi:hypothetical protein
MSAIAFNSEAQRNAEVRRGLRRAEIKPSRFSSAFLGGLCVSAVED